MHYPSLEQVKSMAGQGNLVPVYREVNADLETPVSAYLKIASGTHSFLLESVEGGERLARYSFMGTAPYRVVRTGEDQPESAVDPLTIVENELSRFKPVFVDGLPRFLGGAVGYLSYDCVGNNWYRLNVLPCMVLDPMISELLDDNSIDIVYSKSFIEHLHYPERYLEEAYRVLKPNGIFLTLTPDWQSNYKIFFQVFIY